MRDQVVVNDLFDGLAIRRLRHLLRGRWRRRECAEQDDATEYRDPARGHGGGMTLCDGGPILHRGRARGNEARRRPAHSLSSTSTNTISPAPALKTSCSTPAGRA